MPRRKTSDKVKQLRGTDQPCRLTGDTLEFDDIEGVPEAPQSLEIEGKKYWDRIVPILIQKRVLTIADHEALEVMCALYGGIKKMINGGLPVPAASVTQLRLYQTEFGLTPASRNKISRPDETPSGNRFAGRGRKPK